jgi:hypothetical protein
MQFLGFLFTHMTVKLNCFLAHERKVHGQNDLCISYTQIVPYLGSSVDDKTKNIHQVSKTNIRSIKIETENGSTCIVVIT